MELIKMKNQVKIAILSVLLFSMLSSLPVKANEGLDIPFSLYVSGSVTYEVGSKTLNDLNGLVTVEVGGTLKAPLLYNSMAMNPNDNAITESDIQLSKDDNESIPNEQPIEPAFSSKEEFNLGIPLLDGSRDYVVENSTDLTISSPLDLTDNGLIDDAINYLVLQDAYTADLSANTTIKVSYGISATANISDALECWNATIQNSPLIMSKNYWYNLYMVVYDGSLSFTHVINIEINNVVLKGHYTFDNDVRYQVIDTRYSVNYIGSGRDLVTAGIPSTTGDYNLRRVDPDFSGIDLTSSLWEQVTPAKLMSMQSDINEVHEGQEVKMSGWLTADDLNEDIKELFAFEAGIEVSQIRDFHVNELFPQWHVPAEISQKAYRYLKEACEETSDLPSAYTKAKNNLMSGVYLIVDDFNTHSVGFFDGIGDAIGSAADFCTDTAGGVFGASQDALGGLGDYSLDLLGATGDTGSQLIGATGNSGSQLIGATGTGVSGIIDSTGTAVSGISTAVIGKDGLTGVFGALSMPIIIGIVVVCLIIGLYVWFNYKKAKTAQSSSQSMTYYQQPPPPPRY